MAQWFEEFGAPTHNPKEYRAWTTWKKGQEIRARISGKLKARKSCAILNKFVDQFFDEIKGTDPEKEASATVYSNPDSDELGLTAIRIGDIGTVSVPDPPYFGKSVATIHTHPSGDLNFSPSDYLVALNSNLKGMCVVDKNGKRHCEVLKSKIKDSEREQIVNMALSILSPNISDRQEVYRATGERIKEIT